MMRPCLSSKAGTTRRRAEWAVSAGGVVGNGDTGGHAGSGGEGTVARARAALDTGRDATRADGDRAAAHRL